MILQTIVNDFVTWGTKQEKVKLIKKEDPVMLKSPEDFPVYWFETSDSVSHRYQFQSDGHLSVNLPLPRSCLSYAIALNL